MFQHVEPYAGAPILSLNEAFQSDPRPGKINLSVGIYFDDDGRIPALDAVRRAEQRVVAAGGPKPYLPMEGAANFRAEVQKLLFGAEHAALRAGQRGGQRGDECRRQAGRIAQGLGRFPLHALLELLQRELVSQQFLEGQPSLRRMTSGRQRGDGKRAPVSAKPAACGRAGHGQHLSLIHI